MTHLRELYRADQLPVLQNRLFSTSRDAKKCIKGDVVLVQDMKTGLIYNHAFKPELVRYDNTYQNEQGVSSMFRAHLRNVSDIIGKYFQSNTLIEVGCGKGFFLEHLKVLGFDITGIDPAYEGANTSIIKDYFTPEIGLQADGIILRHVLEHVQNPVGFLANIHESNGGKGNIYIEVPCFDWICNSKTWFDIFYEHVNYFRINDFNKIFGCVYESGYLFGGQYIYVLADLSTLTKPTFSKIDHFNFPRDFLSSVYNLSKSIKNSENKEVIVWGGSSKGVIFTIFMEREGAHVDYVVDINNLKQGKYLAVTGIKVNKPEDVLVDTSPEANIIVMNSNYLEEIKRITNYKYKYIPVEHDNISK